MICNDNNAGSYLGELEGGNLVFPGLEEGQRCGALQLRRRHLVLLRRQ